MTSRLPEKAPLRGVATVSAEAAIEGERRVPLITLAGPLHGKSRDLARVRQLQLLFNMGAMGLHRFRAKVQSLGDRLDLLPFADPFEDLQFPIRQLVGRTRARLAFAED